MKLAAFCKCEKKMSLFSAPWTLTKVKNQSLMNALLYTFLHKSWAALITFYQINASVIIKISMSYECNKIFPFGQILLFLDKRNSRSCRALKKIINTVDHAPTLGVKNEVIHTEVSEKSFNKEMCTRWVCQMILKIIGPQNSLYSSLPVCSLGTTDILRLFLH